MASFISTNKADLQCVRPGSERSVFEAKGFLNLRKVLMLTKGKSLSPPKNFFFVTCGDFQAVFSAKVNPVNFLFNGLKVLPPAIIKAKLFVEILSENYILDESQLSICILFWNS